jgi:spoIIIJ-associated protein
VESIEVSGKSIDDAILQALVRLQKRRDEVEITVLQEPARGRFGSPSTEARVRATVLSARPGAVITPEMADALLGPDDDEEILPEGAEDEFVEDEEEFEEGEEFEDEEEEYVESEYDEVAEEGAFVQEFQAAPALSQLVAEADNISVTQGEMQEVETPSTEDVAITVDVLKHILQYMNIRATVQVRSQNPLTLNIQGINENLGLLIGRRGETLMALQLLVVLIVSHRTKHRMRITVDAENYRMRREDNLRSLAQRVAQQVRNYRRSIALEAMPPHERRIVHLALAESKDISTESIGEGDARRVVISLKRPVR